MNQHPIILFDGVCNLCNSIVNFIIKKDKNANIRFAALQSQKGKTFLQQYHLPTNTIHSFVFIQDNKAFTQSTAALKVCKHLGGLWQWCYGFIIVPKFLRDAIYKYIAKNRYKWFGVQQTCIMPTPDIQKRFLS